MREKKREEKIEYSNSAEYYSYVIRISKHLSIAKENLPNYLATEFIITSAASSN